VIKSRCEDGARVKMPHELDLVNALGKFPIEFVIEKKSVTFCLAYKLLKLR